jgi:hypothetical protein
MTIMNQIVSEIRNAFKNLVNPFNNTKNMRIVIFALCFLLPVSDCHTPNLEPTPNLIKQDIDKLSLKERLYLFCSAYDQTTLSGVSRMMGTDSLILDMEVWYPKSDILLRKDSITNLLKYASPMIGDFVLADSIHLFPAIAYRLHDDSRPPCSKIDNTDEEFDFKIYDYRTLGRSTKEKASYFRDALFLGGLCQYDNTGFVMTKYTQYPSYKKLHPLTEELSKKYARLFYTYIMAADSAVKHVTFIYKNKDENGALIATKFDYQRYDKLFLDIKDRIAG